MLKVDTSDFTETITSVTGSISGLELRMKGETEVMNSLPYTSLHLDQQWLFLSFACSGSEPLSTAQPWCVHPVLPSDGNIPDNPPRTSERRSFSHDSYTDNQKRINYSDWLLFDPYYNNWRNDSSLSHDHSKELSARTTRARSDSLSWPHLQQRLLKEEC